MFVTVLDDDDDAAEPEPDGREILEAAWAAHDDLQAVDLAPDMVQIVPTAFRWLTSRRRPPGEA